MAPQAQDKIQGVIFDYGRVLAHTLDTTPRTRWEQRLGLPTGALTSVVHDADMWVAAQQGTISTAAHWHSVGKTLKLSATQLAAMRADFYRGDALNMELVAYIDGLRLAGLRVGLLSNFSTDLRAMLHQQDLLRRFNSIAISAEIGLMKPAAAAYHAILTMLGVAATAAVFVDDLPENVVAAEALGIRGVVFHDTPSCLRELRDLINGSLFVAPLLREPGPGRRQSGPGLAQNNSDRTGDIQ